MLTIELDNGEKMKTAILKISGKTISEFIETNKWIELIKDLYKVYDSVVLVHGAGKTISEWADKIGLETKFIDGQRVTTSEYMKIVAAVQAGLINTQLSAKLNSCEIEAAGFSGVDRNTFTAKIFDNELGFVGYPELTGSKEWIEEILSKKIVPVFSSVCKDSNGELINVNADIFTEVLAAAIQADTVLFVSDIDGVIINGEIKKQLNTSGIVNGILSGEITGGMIPKLKSCSTLLYKGINKIWIGSKLNHQTITNNEDFNGTWIIGSEEENKQLHYVA